MSASLWLRLRNNLKNELDPEEFSTWFQPLRLGREESGRLLLPEGREVRFLPISVLHRKLHMQVEMPGILNTRMRMTSGRGVILGGVEHGAGYLIVYMVPNFRLPRVASARSKPNPLLHRVKSE